MTPHVAAALDLLDAGARRMGAVDARAAVALVRQALAALEQERDRLVEFIDGIFQAQEPEQYLSAMRAAYQDAAARHGQRPDSGTGTAGGTGGPSA